jgi:phospholipid/cholesterol/gamma-HCH transport system substrate-binding protein
VQGLVEQLTVLVSDPQVKGSMRGTLANIEQSTANLAKISSNLEKLSSDPKVNEDLRATISGTRVTVEETQQLIRRLNRIVGRGGGAVEGTKERLRRTDLSIDLLQQTSPGRPRVDVNAVVPSGAGRFYRLGVYDLSETNGLTLQLGQPLGRHSLRYGLYASRLGAGFDIGSPSHPRLSLDLYGLDEPQLDLRARTQLRENLDLSFGVQSVFDRNIPTVGVTWRR